MAGLAPRAMKKQENADGNEKKGFNMMGYGLATPSNEASIRFRFPRPAENNNDNPFESDSSLQVTVSKHRRNVSHQVLDGGQNQLYALDMPGTALGTEMEEDNIEESHANENNQSIGQK